jgi:outer membrane protein TolC
MVKFLCASLLFSGAALFAQSVAPSAAQPVASSSASISTAPTQISLDQAVHLAESNEPTFVAALAQGRLARLDRSIAIASLLPSAIYHNQYLFTQGNGSTDRIGQTTTSSAPRFIANNAVHEYASEGIVNETIGLQQFSAVAAANARVAQAAAEAEIARRGLFSAVVALYYGVAAAETKLAVVQRSADEAAHFFNLTQQREQAREAAHADVVKADLQQQQRIRDVQDATLAASTARLELAVLLFPDPRTPFQTESPAPPVLPDRSVIDADASKNNPELMRALAALHASEADVTTARAAYLPDLGLNVTYGIDAPQFAINGPNSTRNLGYSASATLDIPVWDWLSTEHKVKQSEIRRNIARVELSATQRRLIANLSELYDGAVTTRDQLSSLDRSVTTAQESLRLTELRYTGGDGSVLEVVDAQNSLLAAEVARADGVVRYQLALANLQTLTGRF